MSGFRKTLQFISLMLTLTMCSFSHALGLGAFHLYSSLNEPLDAEVEILQAQNYDLDALKALLAPKEDYQRANLQRPRDPFRFDLRQFKNLTFIHLTSEEPIRQAYLDFLLELNWPHGRIIRAYNVLLDPPSLQAQDVKRLSDIAEHEVLPAAIDRNLKLANPVAMPATTSIPEPVASPAAFSPVKVEPINTPPQAALIAPPIAPPTPTVTLSPVKAPTVLTEDITERIQASKQLSAAEIINFNKMRGIEHNLRQLFDPEIKTDTEVKVSPPVAMPQVTAHPVSHQPPQEAQESHPAPVPAVTPKPVPINPPPVVPHPVTPPMPKPSPNKTPMMSSPFDNEGVKYGLMALCALMLAMGIRIAWQRRKAAGTSEDTIITAPMPVAAAISDEPGDLTPAGSLDNEMFLKLELARGYASINELDNAREALEEVLARGNDFQKQEAEQIMATL